MTETTRIILAQLFVEQMFCKCIRSACPASRPVLDREADSLCFFCSLEVAFKT